MTIWIDLANAPHVPFFTPIIEDFQKSGHQVVITARDFNHTPALCELAGLSFTTLGSHGGRKNWQKVMNIPSRVHQLMKFARKLKPDLALSHNSYTQTIAGRLLGCRVVTLMDYEGQPANHLAFRMAHRIIVPESFPDGPLRRFGAGKKKVKKYEGFKEQVYLAGFEEDSQFLDKLLQDGTIPGTWKKNKDLLITVRSPATMSAYHNFENPIFEYLLQKMSTIDDSCTLVLCRSESQRDYYRGRFPSLQFPVNPIPGKDLVYYSDYLLSAGGTMNREAAILGTSVYTLFAGKLPAVDDRLIGMERMKQLQTTEDIDNLNLEKRSKMPPLINSDLKQKIITMILETK